MNQKDQKIIIQGKDLIEKLGLENLPEEKQEKLVREMSEIIYERIILKVIGKLSDQEAAELNEIFEKGDLKKVDEYLKDKMPNFATLLKEEIEKYQEEMTKL